MARSGAGHPLGAHDDIICWAQARWTGSLRVYGPEHHIAVIVMIWIYKEAKMINPPHHVPPSSICLFTSTSIHSSPHYTMDQHLLFIILFDSFHGSMTFLLFIIFVTALFSARIVRSRPWFQFISVTIIGGLSSLAIVGFQYGPPPPHALCLFQAAALYSSNPLSVALLLIIIDL